MNTKKQRVLTGSRPSGSPHLGNYFGAFKPSIDLQQTYDLFLFLADFHALNENYTAAELREFSIDMAAVLLACGLDPKRSCFYAQSAVPEVNELAWILGCQTPYGLMLRAHSFKDAQAKSKEVNMGVFEYPILMAADILMFEPALVPVGKDQKQHLEMARDIATRFNNRYGDTFRLPEPLISDVVGLVPGTDGEKMSKSKGNIVSLFATEQVWKKQIMSVVTDAKGLADPKDPSTCNVFALFKLIATDQEAEAMADKYRSGGYGYGHAKQDVLAKMIERFSAMRDRYLDFHKHPDTMLDLLREGSKRAQDMARIKMDIVQSRLGLIGLSHRFTQMEH